MRLPVSAVVIACNEAEKISACLQSLAFCDEIVVVDSGSVDATCDIAERFGARVIKQDWLGFGMQKGFAVAQAKHDWVLCIDADEQVCDELRQSIEAALVAPEAPAYSVTRCNRFMGRWLRFGEGYPDICLRLFDRRCAEWSRDRVHEKVILKAVEATRHLHAKRDIPCLRGDLLHESEMTLEQYLVKQNSYTSLQADELIERGKRVTVAKLLLSPLFRFIKFYLLKQGFRDGLPGFVHISLGCFNSFIKYAKVWSFRSKQKYLVNLDVAESASTA